MWKIDQYIYRNKVTVETDYKPLVGILKKTYSQHTKTSVTYASQASEVCMIYISLTKGVEMYLVDAV